MNTQFLNSSFTKSIFGAALLGALSGISVQAAVDFHFPPFRASENTRMTLHYAHPGLPAVDPNNPNKSKKEKPLQVHLFFDIFKWEPPPAPIEQALGDPIKPPAVCAKSKLAARDACDQEVEAGEAVSYELNIANPEFKLASLVRAGATIIGPDRPASTVPPSLEIQNPDGSVQILIGLLLPAKGPPDRIIAPDF